MTKPSRIEVRSFDYVPLSERSGKAWHQAPFWFTGQFVATTMIIGFIGPAMGLSLGLSIVAAVLGAVFGTFFMAFHANQGPTMGLPQMIQSRAQFGVRGATVPMAAALFQYLGLGVLGLVLTPQAIGMVLPGPAPLWGLVVLVLGVVLAIVGHDLLHAVLRWLPYVAVPFFAVLTVLALVHLHPMPPTPTEISPVTAFMAQFAASAAYQLGYAVYVSDYSRYLPESTPSRALIGWTFLGAVGAPLWLTPLGSFIASSVPVADALPNLRDVGDLLFPGFGTLAVVITLVPISIALLGINLYGAMLSVVSSVAAFRPIEPTVRVRVIGVVGAGVVSYLGALATPAAYLGTMNAFLQIVLYLLVPWTAVNLADYYWVRRGHYAITALYDPSGIYGSWNARGLVAYGLGLAAMVPFISLGFYVGPAAKLLDGVDIAFAVGLAVAGGAYLVMARGFRREDEHAAVEASKSRLAAAD
ncbi:purine-cytosine permease family protein [Amycolatopsis jejuensis]|uniref:purine-cytosine permease family protein n=1 Tax=Amycolatopsis jejuensis TaxID=330084 RepID=UPI000525721A|nr:cytosine permease [Amycolatopsis jejuensis]